MTERLLQFIWQFRYYNNNRLTSTNGQVIQVINPGIHNTNQGPDFLNAKIRVGETLWAGHVELHIKSGDWLKHRHSTDSNYNNVILHVVWIHDNELNLGFPTIELQHTVAKVLLDKYNGLMQGNRFIPCEEHPVSTINEAIMVSWKTRLLAERLQAKSSHINSLLQHNKMHWEETCWWLLARNFGSMVNSDSFEKIAGSIPFTLLSRLHNNQAQLEALLLGQAGLLDGTFTNDYPKMLQQEFRFLQHKYKLRNPHAALLFLRMRPANFPTIRLSQLANLIHGNKQLFSTFLEAESIEKIEKLLMVSASAYWQTHYVFDEPGHCKQKNTGKQMVRNIIINTIIPLIYTYGQVNKNEKLISKSMQWLSGLPAEKNSIVRGFEKLGIENKSAYDSQALLQLKQQYCNQKRCLQCSIGNIILQG